MVIGGAWWLAGLNSTVTHLQSRVGDVESSLKDIKNANATATQLQNQQATQLEVRLTRMEIMLQSVLDAARDAAARERRRENEK